MAKIIARRFYVPISSWVHAFILTCDNKLAVWFKKHVHHHHGIAYGGVPGVCCLYPGSDQSLFDLAITWYSPGHFVHQFLYRKMGYQIVQPPSPPFGCGTVTTVQSSDNPATVGDSITFTATVTDLVGIGTPVGTVAFYDGSTLLGQGSALAGSAASAVSTFTTSALTAGTHTITAVFTPAATGDAGFVTSQGSLSQVVNSPVVAVACCPASLPVTLHASLGNGARCTCIAGTTVTLTYNSSSGKWEGSAATSCPGGTITLKFYCVSGGTDCTGFRLDYSWNSNCGGGTAQASAGCSCSPLSVSFIGFNNGTTCCNSGGLLATMSATVTQ
jgi:hypothetical protein